MLHGEELILSLFLHLTAPLLSPFSVSTSQPGVLLPQGVLLQLVPRVCVVTLEWVSFSEKQTNKQTNKQTKKPKTIMILMKNAST